MTLSKKQYKSISALVLMFQAGHFSAFLIVIMNLLRALLPTAFMALATGNFINTATAIFQRKLNHDKIYLSLIILFIVLCAQNIIDAINNLLISRVELNLQRKLGPAIVKKHAALDYTHIENGQSWELISRVSREPVKSLVEGIDAFMQLIYIFVGLISILFLILTEVWWAALIIISSSAPLIWLSIHQGKKNYQARRDSEKYRRRADYISEEILTGQGNIEERSLFGYGEHINKMYCEQFEKYRILELKTETKHFIMSKFASTMLAIVSILITLTLINPVISGRMSVGMFMGIISAIFGMIGSFGFQLSHSLENVSRLGEYMKDLSEFIALSEVEDAYAMPDAKPMEFNTLEFCKVRFKYPGDSHYILDGLSFKLESGRQYAFVGRNGAGKTTIIKLLAGLYRNYEGEILINGKELRSYSPSSLKALFSVVYQDFAKYYISLKDNILLGDISNKNKSERVVNTISSAGLDEMLSDLRDGMETPLGKIKEGGQEVSGGQWQRIAIARSLISRAPVKILDEPTSALDPISESYMYSEFEKLMHGKTTIFISHRLGSTKLADEILVIDHGCIIERGTHDELLTVDREYAKMFEAQRGWYE